MGRKKAEENRRRLTPPVRRMKHREWADVGRALYGPEGEDWEFRCVSCGAVQSAAMIRKGWPGIDLSEWQTWVNFSCIGRRVEELGCDWTLGGLFRIHTVEVEFEGEMHPTFEFAKASVIPESYLIERMAAA